MSLHVLTLQGFYQVSFIGKDSTRAGGCGCGLTNVTAILSCAQVVVDERLRVISDPHQSVYALGDCAQIRGHAHPCTAQVAERQGRYLAKSVGHTPTPDSPDPPEFTFQSWMMLAYVGGYRAIHDTKVGKSQGKLRGTNMAGQQLISLVSAELVSA